MSSRADLIQNAILFLQDPKTQSSPLTSKIEFLQAKGLNEGEIQEALSRSASSKSSSTQGLNTGYSNGQSYRMGDGYGGRMEMAPVPPKRDWRDLFIMAVVSGGVVYGLTALARKYLVPHLQPPSTTAFQSTSADITAQYDEAASLLKELQDQTTKLQDTLDGDRERVNKIVSEVEEAVISVREAEESWRGEMREIRGEVESVRELVPRMIEKHSASQSSALADLQSEMKSLKTLLLSRQNIPQPTPGTGASTPNGSTTTSTSAAANALLGQKGRSIPAWQMAPSRSEGSEAGSAGSAEGDKGKEKEQA